MTDTRRTYIDPTGSSILFYSLNPLDGGWYPDTDFLEDWRLLPADVWVYRPVDRPDIFITVPDGRIWPLMTVDEAADIRAFPDKPWIQGGTVIDYYPLLAILGGQTHHPSHHSVQENEGLMALAVAAITEGWIDFTTNSESPLPLSQSPTVSAPLPSHIVSTLLRCAESEGLTCAITMEPVTAAEGAVTSCGHYFQKAAVERWLSEHGTCPECRQPAVI
jgi:hypothetical protein